jgi:hypothetical protein
MKSFNKYNEAMGNYKETVSKIVSPNVNSAYKHIKSLLKDESKQNDVMNVLMGLAFLSYDKGVRNSH